MPNIDESDGLNDAVSKNFVLQAYPEVRLRFFTENVMELYNQG